MPNDNTDVMANEAVKGVMALLRAGRLGESRETRRDLVRQASAHILAATGKGPFYNPPGGEDGSGEAAWRAAARGDAPIEAWLARAMAALRSEDDASGRVLLRSVIRPLAGLLGATLGDAAEAEATARRIAFRCPQAGGAPDDLASLASELVTAAHCTDAPSPVIEAAAALVRMGGAGAGDPPPAEPMLRVGRNGPLLLTGAAGVEDHLGVPISTARPVALCRCGRSASKPFCDGSHVEAAFSGDKAARREPDRRDAYAGQQATIYDNRGLCAHSGFCTDRLSTVFHLGDDPFVTPSGARLDDIMRAVRRCPSGALSFGMDGIEDKAQVDQRRPAVVQVSKDGPYRMTGSIRLIDDDGQPVERPAGVSAEHFSLCRCGASLNKPFCSGMHWSVGFADPRSDVAAEPTLFEWAGGYPALLDMTRIFYGRHVPADPLIGPLFSAMAPDHPERVAAWLGEVFGGPPLYSQRYGGYAHMISEHLDKHLSHAQRAHWAQLMVQSADEAGLPDDAEFRAAFTAYIEWGSRIAVENSQGGARPPAHMPMPRWWWVCDAVPGARVPANAAMIEEPSTSDAPVLTIGERTSFERHVRPLFRASDRASMRFALDLWAYEDVRANADAILDRVRDGTMPCDAAWSADKVALLERWTDDGHPP